MVDLYEPIFNKKFKIVLKHGYAHELFMDMMVWLETYSIGAIDIKVIPIIPAEDIWFAPQGLLRKQFMYIAFEDLDDALFFKIKYSV